MRFNYCTVEWFVTMKWALFDKHNYFGVAVILIPQLENLPHCSQPPVWTPQVHLVCLLTFSRTSDMICRWVCTTIYRHHWHTASKFRRVRNYFFSEVCAWLSCLDQMITSSRVHALNRPCDFIICIPANGRRPILSLTCGANKHTTYLSSQGYRAQIFPSLQCILVIIP